MTIPFKASAWRLLVKEGTDAYMLREYGYIPVFDVGTEKIIEDCAESHVQVLIDGGLLEDDGG